MDKLPAKSRFSEFRKKLVFFGPGLLLAITAAGEAGIADALHIGAHFGMSLVWVVIIALIFKYAFTTGIARYTLATGITIFQAMTDVPGPKNWAAYLTIAAYVIDAIAIGAMIVFAGTFLEYLIPGSYVFYLICFLIIVLALLILRTHIYHHFERIMAILVLFLGIAVIAIMAMHPSSIITTLQGIVPSVPHHSEKEILAIIGAVGSGLMLMLYSVWLEKKIRIRNEDPNTPPEERFEVGNKTQYYRYMRSVRIDILIGFIIVAVITVGFMMVGYIGRLATFLPEGTEITLDMLLSMVLNLYHSIPYANQIFFIIVSVIFFGAIVVGLDARASAITKIVKDLRIKAGKPIKNTSLVYNLCLLCFSVIAFFTIIYNNPLVTISHVSLICAIFFGIFGFILIYLNRKLPEYAQGNRLWMLFIGIGSVLSIYFALVLEGTLLSSGLNLLKDLALILVLLYLFCRTQMFKRLAEGTSSLADKFWLIIILSAISILATVWGMIPVPGTEGTPVDYLCFCNLGSIIGGVVGGPVIGGIVGVIIGVYRLSLGDVSAIPSFIAIVATGIIAGYMVRHNKGKLSFKLAALLAVTVECLHLLFIYPTYEIILHQLTGPAILDVIRHSILPALLVSISACVCFALFNRNIKCFTLTLRPFSFALLKQEWKELIHVVTKDKEKK
ncbi:MAG TPA: Nramp family divalent metal transporter [Methanocorpusculum sp.]|nr:Nramp family divalent metal transporter [Methanocorpusculum sp.]